MVMVMNFSARLDLSADFLRTFRTIILVLGLAGYGVSAVAADVLVFNPQPFRLDERFSRSYDLEEYGLLHRYSYLPEPEWRRLFDTGLMASIGSVTSKEFYSLFHLQHSVKATENFSLEIEADRGEDFDGRYERTLFGLSYRWQQWELSAFSGLVADKSSEDIRLDLKYNFDASNFLRGSIVAVDFVANDKQEAIEYTRLPYTYYLEWGLDVSPQWRWNSYINYNAPLTLIDQASLDRFEYEKLTLQSDLYFQKCDSYLFYWSVALEKSSRELFRESTYALFDRDFYSLTFRFDRHFDSGDGYWLGVRALRLTELDSGFSEIDQRSQLERNEWIVFAGWRWQVWGSQFFSPNVYIDPLDNGLTSTSQTQPSIRNNETLVKLSLPYEWQFQNDLKIVLNTTYEVDQNNFGGLNLQFNYPF